MTFENTRHEQGPTTTLFEHQKSQSIYDLARESFERANGDVKKAAAHMIRRVKADRVLLAELGEEFIRIVCQVATDKVLRDRRRVVWLPPNYDKGGKGGRVAKLAAGNQLIYFPLPGGKPLGNASAEEVESAATFYGTQARDMSWKARWLHEIAKRVPNGKLVKDVLNEKTLTKLKSEAQNV